jgi:ferredoxin
MAYVITDTCIKDSLCVELCPTDCIHPKQDEPAFEAATQMYVDPEGCIDCGACIPACTSDSIQALEDVPEDNKEFIEKNAASIGIWTRFKGLSRKGDKGYGATTTISNPRTASEVLCTSARRLCVSRFMTLTAKSLG